MLLLTLLLFVYLGLYTWNARTGHLDYAAEYTGLSIVGAVLYPGKWVAQEVEYFWNHYIYLVGVVAENQRLKASMGNATLYLSQAAEEHAELQRLYKLLDMTIPDAWQSTGVRVLASRMGPQAVLETFIVDKGLSQGALPGRPVIVPEGLVGRIFRASPTTANVLLLTDRGFRVAVLTSDGRVAGVLAGNGSGALLSMHYVAQNIQVLPGDILVTSGQEGDIPKGIPVAQVINVGIGPESLFQQISAIPLVQLYHVESALLLHPPDSLLPFAAQRTWRQLVEPVVPEADAVGGLNLRQAR